MGWKVRVAFPPSRRSSRPPSQLSQSLTEANHPHLRCALKKAVRNSARFWTKAWSSSLPLHSRQGEVVAGKAYWSSNERPRALGFGTHTTIPHPPTRPSTPRTCCRPPGCWFQAASAPPAAPRRRCRARQSASCAPAPPAAPQSDQRTCVGRAMGGGEWAFAGWVKLAEASEAGECWHALECKCPGSTSVRQPALPEPCHALPSRPTAPLPSTAARCS